MKKITFKHNIAVAGGWKTVTIKGYQITHLNNAFVVHKFYDLKYGYGDSWAVSELTTGLYIGVVSDTRGEAIKEAIKTLDERGKEQLNNVIATQLKQLEHDNPEKKEVKRQEKPKLDLRELSQSITDEYMNMWGVSMDKDVISTVISIIKSELEEQNKIEPEKSDTSNVDCPF